MRSERNLDWRGLRLALGLTHEQMGTLLRVSERQIYYLEAGGCQGISGAAEILLRTWLQHPEAIRRLKQAGFPHPFPDDLARRTNKGTA